MIKEPLISVIMPVFDGENFLAQAIRSVLAQTYKHFELIVVNDGSNDSSKDIVQKFISITEKIRCIDQENSGVSHARNMGILASKGDLVAFLDQDDLWADDTLETQMAFHRQQPDIGYTLAHQVCFLDGISEPPAWFRLQQLNAPHVGYLPGTLVVKREILDRIGLFDTQYPISSDADWFARARDAAVLMKILPQTLLRRRIHSGNQSRHSKQIQGELTQLLRASIQRKRNAE